MNDGNTPFESLLSRHPGIPYVFAWGWLGGITYQRGARDGIGEGPPYFEERIVGESRRWGANLLEFYPPEMNKGFPFPAGGKKEPDIPRNYWGGFENPKWSMDPMRELFRFAHDRGLLVHIFYHPGLIEATAGNDRHQQRLQATRIVSRLLHGVTLFSWERCADGFAYEGWFRDSDGTMNEILWTHDPGAYVTSTQTRPAPTPNFGQGTACAVGRFGITCGLSDRWQDRHLGSTRQSAQLDCRIRKNSSRDWGFWGRYGGGSYPDWMMKQLHDFLRERRETGTGVWWLGEPEATLPAEYRAYVYGISQDPLREAVATSLYSTGEGGFRDIVRRTEWGAPKEYGHEYDFPYQSRVLQNNYLRLVRSHERDSGALLYDATHLAHFDAHAGQHAPVALSSACLETLLNFGAESAQPDAGDAPDQPWELWIGVMDRSDSEFRKGGGYESTLSFDAAVHGAETFPACLAYEKEPEWPGEVKISFEAPLGTYELTIYQLRLFPGFEVQVDGPVEVGIDGDLVGLYATRSRGGEERVVFSIDSAGVHALSLRPVKESSHRFDAIRIRRVSKSWVSHGYIERAGALAILEERISTPAGDGTLSETRRWRMTADAPWLTVRIERRLTGENMPLATMIGVAGYDVLRVGATEYERPVGVEVAPPLMTLQDSRGIMPSLHVLSRTRAVPGSVQWLPKMSLSIASRDTAHEVLDLAFVADTDLYRRFLSSGLDADQITRAVFAPTATPDPQGIVENSFEVPRVSVARVKYAGPCLVREEGHGQAGPWWYSRGVQASDEEPGTNLVKLYLQSGGQAVVREDGFIRGWVRPGWGCQNALAICADGLTSRSCEVEVLKTSYLVFAPRIEYPSAICEALLNGKPWRYFDGTMLFLPNAKGRYRVEITTSAICAPSVARTWLRVNGSAWDPVNQTLTITGEHAEHFRQDLPGGLLYTAEIRTADLEIVGVSNRGSVVPADSAEMKPRVVRLRPGATVISFAR